ncbi:SRPBCC family protein [Erythrobacter sp. NFXS35]|uniref:SRPBCC family protein n=1 Tax=Erythrobacter sp. NFXS35 TaxID=2818436 RepID=UPI0032E00BA5
MPNFRLFNVLCAALLLPTVPAAAEISGTGPNGFVSRHEAVVEGSPRDVWLALITPSGWWASEHTWSGEAANLTLTPQAGGCFCEKIPEMEDAGRFTLEGSVEHMRVVHAYPERALRMQGALGPLQSEPVTGILTITISKVEGGTRIVWEYNVGGAMRYEVPVIARAVDGVMGIQLTALADLLGPVETAPQPQPAPAAVSDETAGSDQDEVPPTDREAPPEGDAPERKTPSVSDVFSDLADED